MPTDQITFIVYGQPQTAGSKKAFALRRRDGSLVTRPNGSPVINVTDDNAKGRDWKNAVASEARASVGQIELLDGPLQLTLEFFLPRPKGHYRTGRNSGQLKPSAPAYPAVKPDVLKMTRAVEDALTGVLWRDDAQVCAEVLVKRYGEPARVQVTVRRLESTVEVMASAEQLSLLEA